MTTSTDNSTAGSAPTPPIDREAAFASGAPRMSRRVVFIGLAVMAAVALLGVAGEHFFSDIGLNPAPPKPAPVVSPPREPTGIPQIDAPLPAFMGIVKLAPAAAPGISLVNQYGRSVSLPTERGRVVVLSFFDGSCTDICAVLASELAKAKADLGARSARVIFLTVNTDPLHPSVSGGTPAVAETPLSHLSNWYLLGGSLPVLNSIWRDYGLSINVSRSTGIVAHNDAMYFIDPQGRLRYKATPYANESPTGVFSLPPANIARWAAGIAAYTEQLLPRPS